MDRKAWWIAIGLLALVGLATPLASAQNAQTVNVEIDAFLLDTPDELPGVYSAGLEVTTKASGGHCACRQTTVDLQAREVPAEAHSTVFSPASFVVDWTDRENLDDGRERDVRFDIGVSEAHPQVSMLSVKIDADVESSNQFVDDVVHETELALPIPENATYEETDEEAEPSSDASGEEDAKDAPAETHADRQAPVQESGVALETGAGVAGLALTGLAVHRYRDGS